MIYKIYFKAVLLFLVVAGLLIGVLPPLISASDSSLNILGIAVIILMFPIGYYGVSNIINDLKQHKENINAK